MARKNRKSTEEKFILRLALKLIRTSIIYFLILAIIMGICWYLFSRVYWYGSEMLYPIIHLISSNKILTLVIVFFVGFIFICKYYWKIVSEFFVEIVNGMEKLYSTSSESIKLNVDLIELENKMNKIRTNILRDRLIAKEAEQRKNDLVVYLAHDLKTPLTSIIGYLSLLSEETELKETIKLRYIQVALQKSERLEELINEFFEITRFNLTNIELEKSTINLTRMLEQLIFEFSPMWKEKNIQCELHTEPDIMYACDVDKIQRVFDNLLKNAVNYSYSNSKMQVSIKTNENKIVIIFNNQGPTIPKDKQKRIFEQFYRLDQSRGTKTGGSGLGLAIAKEIIELHNGLIEVESEKEETKFQITLNKE